MSLRLTLDGEPLVLPEPITIEQLLRDQDLSPEILSVIVDGRAIPRRDYAEVMVHDGAELVVVVQVGGG